MFDFWLAYKLFRGGGRFVGLSSVLSILGMIIGVGILIATMAVVSGFEKSIRSSVVDLSGHIILMKRGAYLDKLPELAEKIKTEIGAFEYVPFVHLEAISTNQGRVTGVAVQGVDTAKPEKVLKLESRLIAGSWEWQDSSAVIGKELSKKLDLNIGDEIKIIVPRPSAGSDRFQPKLKRFTILGIIDFGKFDYNERIVLVSNPQAQSLLGLKPEFYSGIRLKIEQEDRAQEFAYKIENSLGFPYHTKNWYLLNRNFFEALEIEKRVIFLVLLVMVIAASFNISASLFISVVKRYSNISILKAMGAGPGQILRIFCVQGIMVGLIGSFLGLCLGLLLCYFLSHYQAFDLPADIYKIDRLPIDLRLIDICTVLGSAFLLSFLASLIPAIRGSKLAAIEGLKYE